MSISSEESDDGRAGEASQSLGSAGCIQHTAGVSTVCVCVSCRHFQESLGLSLHVKRMWMYARKI